MPNHRSLFIVTAALSLGLATPLLAQDRSAVTPAQLDAAAAARPAGDRQEIRSLLSTDEARTLASRMGVSAADLSARVASLDEATLSLLAERAQAGERDLAGGDNTVVISTTAIIIGLLVLILLLK